MKQSVFVNLMLCLPQVLGLWLRRGQDKLQEAAYIDPMGPCAFSDSDDVASSAPESLEGTESPLSMSSAGAESYERPRSMSPAGDESDERPSSLSSAGFGFCESHRSMTLTEIEFYPDKGNTSSESPSAGR